MQMLFHEFYATSYAIQNWNLHWCHDLCHLTQEISLFEIFHKKTTLFCSHFPFKTKVATTKTRPIEMIVLNSNNLNTLEVPNLKYTPSRRDHNETIERVINFNKSTSNDAVRHRLFAKLGVIGQPNKIPKTPKIESILPYSSAMQPRTERASQFETLKYTLSHSDLKHESSKQKRQRRRVNFNEQVLIKPIPMRNEYSNRVASRIWCNAGELYEMALRNQEEFMAEGWNWRTVLEEEDMYATQTNGKIEYIHPVHIQLMNEYNSEPSLLV